MPATGKAPRQIDVVSGGLMVKLIIFIPLCLILLASAAMTQEVIITNFPVGVGGSVKAGLFQPYYPKIKAIVDTLHHYPLARAIVSGGADGAKFANNNDALNPGLALGRAHILRDLLISEFKVDSTQIIIQSMDEKARGEQYRFACIRIDRTLANLDSRLSSLENRPQPEIPPTEISRTGISLTEHLGLRLGAGISSSPVGAIPIIAGSVTWKRMIFVEAMVGHTFWKSTYSFAGNNLSTRRRLARGAVIVDPFQHLPLGFVAGWVRIEEISQLYYKYVKMSEGPFLGLRFSPLDFISLTANYNPSRHRLAGDEISHSDSDQFLFSLMVHKTFGGER
jgi:hypothetical protein